MKLLRSLLSLLLVCCCGVLALAQGSSAQPSGLSEDRDTSAMEAYRSGDFRNLGTSRLLWLEELADPKFAQESGQRGRLCYNLGTLCLREGKNMEAVAWFSAAMKLRPRDAETWANLEVARLNAGLDGADRGDLKASVERLLTSLTQAESSILALLGLLPVALALLFEALRGGRRSRFVLVLGLLFWSVCLAPWVRHRWTAGNLELMVIATEGSAGRSGPRQDAPRVEKLEAGTVWALVDQLPGWSEVQLDAQRRVWLRSEDAFELAR